MVCSLGNPQLLRICPEASAPFTTCSKRWKKAVAYAVVILWLVWARRSSLFPRRSTCSAGCAMVRRWRSRRWSFSRLPIPPIYMVPSCAGLRKTKKRRRRPRQLTRSVGASVMLRNGELAAYLRRNQPNLQVFLPADEPERSSTARDLQRFLAACPAGYGAPGRPTRRPADLHHQRPAGGASLHGSLPAGCRLPSRADGPQLAQGVVAIHPRSRGIAPNVQ